MYTVKTVQVLKLMVLIQADVHRRSVKARFLWIIAPALALKLLIVYDHTIQLHTFFYNL